MSKENMNNILQARSLSKVYASPAEPVRALCGVSLSLCPGDYISVVGPSGAGKSTLLHVLGGLDTPSGGEVLFAGQDIYKMKDAQLSLWRAKRIGFVFQFYHLIEELNLWENLVLAANITGEDYSLKRIEELVEYLGISSRRCSFPSQLSGGERQKTAIARALVNDPDFIFCDEPTGNLDSQSQNKVVELLDKLHYERKKGIVMVTHNMELARRAKKILFLDGGRLKS